MKCKRFTNPLFVALGFGFLIVSLMTGCGGGTDGVTSDPDPSTEAGNLTENETQDSDEDETQDFDEDDTQDSDDTSGTESSTIVVLP